MQTRMRCYAFTALLALVPCSARWTLAQDRPNASQAVTLTVQAGTPLDVALDKPLPIKRAGVPVEGHLVEPLYVFDHRVVPQGSRILGRVTQVENISRKKRALAIANGDFTPLRRAHVNFDTLVLKDGSRIPLRTAVSQGAPSLVHLSAGERSKKRKGRVAQAVGQARQEVKDREHQAIEEVKAPGKLKRLETMAARELPYHRQVLPAGTHFTAELKAPLEFGAEDPAAKGLEQLGGEIPPGSVVRVRLVTSLSSATAHSGSQVQAVVSQPVFSSDHHLILPEGARLEGSVTQAVPARRLGRNGQLRFIFRQIDMPQQAPRKVEASLQAVDAASGAPMMLDEEGGAHAVTPKTHYIAPAIDVLLATSSLDGLEGHHHHIEVDRGPDVAGGAMRGAAGFGLVGSVIGLAAHYRPVSAGFAFYGAGWSVYSHIAARGNDVVFPKNTPMEIRFGTHEGSAPAGGDKAPPARPTEAASGR
jgi:type IV secretory pathway VirB10-like protein